MPREQKPINKKSTGRKDTDAQLMKWLEVLQASSIYLKL
jgi:hypothetical protein